MPTAAEEHCLLAGPRWVTYVSSKQAVLVKASCICMCVYGGGRGGGGILCISLLDKWSWCTFQERLFVWGH